MDRSEFFAIATAVGWRRGQRPTSAQRTAIGNAVRGQLTQSAVSEARVHETQGSRPMTADDAVQGLLEELS